MYATFANELYASHSHPSAPPPSLPPGRSGYCTGREPPQEPQRTRLQLRTFGAQGDTMSIISAIHALTSSMSCCAFLTPRK